MENALEVNAQIAEINAMTEIAKALQLLEADSQRRVLQWAVDSFGAIVGSTFKNPNIFQNRHGEEMTPSAEAGEMFSDIAELYTAASPNNDPEKALVVGYWFQKVNNEAEFDSGSLNRELKHLGHGVGNITSALGSLIARKPQLVIQTKKSGSSQQARKRYRLTNEGIKHVDRMVIGGTEQ